MRRVAALSLLLVSCHSHPSVSVREQDGSRTISYQADRDRVYHASLRALTAEGYKISAADPMGLRIEARAEGQAAIITCEETGRATTRLHLALSSGSPREFRAIFRRIGKSLP